MSLINFNMGCIETKSFQISIVDNDGLTLTWDVLKLVQDTHPADRKTY